MGSGIVRALLLEGATVVAPLRRADQIERLRRECSGACWRAWPSQAGVNMQSLSAGYMCLYACAPMCMAAMPLRLVR